MRTAPPLAVLAAALVVGVAASGAKGPPDHAAVALNVLPPGESGSLAFPPNATDQAALYDGLALLEASPNYSVGRGTDAPFEQIGADWIHGGELAEFLNRWVLPGARVYATRFQPSSGPFAGKMIEGVRFVIVNREQLNSVRLGLDVAYALQRLYPGKINFEACRFLIGSREVVDALKAGTAPGVIEERLRDKVLHFEDRRRQYLLY